ncbi:N-acetyl sugar amidotransferase [Gammaproteobacteria bacterium]|nr:N-acetyl sugar amidotransferase [Gammaproteobacteria bacterium]
MFSKSIRGLPEEVVFCQKCVISNQRPVSKLESSHSVNDYKATTRFQDGVCDACRWAEMKELINWQERNQALMELCDRHRSGSGDYDVIVPASGGKDSRYVAHLLKHEFGMHPLTVTWRPHIYTDIGVKNLLSMIDAGFSNVLVSPDGSVQRRLSQLAFRNLGHPFQPFIVGQRMVGPKEAIKRNVKLVVYGENVAEYGNRIEDNFSPLMRTELFTCFDFCWDTSSVANYMLAGVPLIELVERHGFTRNDLLPYRSPSLRDIEEHRVEVHYMSYYKKWTPQDNYYYAVEHTGFQPNPTRRDGSFSRYAGIDDVLEDLHYYMQVIKFGMGRATWDTAQEIRTGKLEREEAVTLVRTYDEEPPTRYKDEILQYLDLSIDAFDKCLDQFRSRHLWQKNGNQWQLRYQVS